MDPWNPYPKDPWLGPIVFFFFDMYMRRGTYIPYTRNPPPPPPPPLRKLFTVVGLQAIGSATLMMMIKKGPRSFFPTRANSSTCSIRPPRRRSPCHFCLFRSETRSLEFEACGVVCVCGCASGVFLNPITGTLCVMFYPLEKTPGA